MYVFILSISIRPSVFSPLLTPPYESGPAEVRPVQNIAKKNCDLPAFLIKNIPSSPFMSFEI